MKLPRKKRRAFTLIELLIVIAILGIIFSLAVPPLRNSAFRARQTTALAIQSMVATAKARYILDYNASSLDEGDNQARFLLIRPYLTAHNSQMPNSVEDLLAGLTPNSTLEIGDSNTPPSVSGVVF